MYGKHFLAMLAFFESSGFRGLWPDVCGLMLVRYANGYSDQAQTLVNGGSNPSRTTDYVRKKHMKNHARFSVRLANGKEQTFETAAAMAAWVALQRQYDAPRRRSRFAWRKRKQAPLRRIQSTDSQPPLARYANRNSGEA